MWAAVEAVMFPRGVRRAFVEDEPLELPAPASAPSLTTTLRRELRAMPAILPVALIGERFVPVSDLRSTPLAWS
jgi:hypothetical protein